MGEVSCGSKQVHKFTFHSFLINTFCNQLADIIFPCAGPAMQREDEGLLGVFIVHEAGHSFEDNVGCYMLAKQLLLQRQFQTLGTKM